MSHWSRCQTKITDLDVLRNAAKNLGVEVLKRDKNYHSKYDSTKYDAKMVFSYQQSTAAVVINDAGNYELMVDNFCNPIVDKIGEDCQLLGREYSKLTVEKQAMMMGGMITSSTVNSKGEVLMQVSL